MAFFMSIGSDERTGWIMHYSIVDTGKRIRELRKESGLTQEQLAEKVGVTPRMVRAFESGNSGASIDVLVELTMLFNTSLDYLVLGKDTQNDLKDKLNAVLNDFSAIVQSI